MRAHIRRDPHPAQIAYPDMTDADVKAWERTAKWRIAEIEQTANAMLVSMLHYLSTNEFDPHGAMRLRRDWEGMILNRSEIRRDLRVQNGSYVLAATGKNVEDYYMLEELRKKGCDVLEWEKGVTMDDDGRIHFAPWKKGGKA